MIEKLKAVILILVVLLAVSLLIIFNIQNARLNLLREYTATKQRLTEKNEQLISELNKALQENRSLKDRLEAVTRDLERLTSERDEIQRRLQLVAREREKLAQRLESYNNLEEELKSVRDENKTLKERLAALQDAEAELDSLRKENENLRRRINEVKSLLKERGVAAGYAKKQEPEAEEAVKVSKTSGAVELPPIIVSSSSVSSQAEIPYKLEGKLLNVNTEYEFVVIDLGRENGLKENMVFQVLRDGEPIGKVKVIQIRDKIAACDIIESLRPFKLGDVVRY